MKSFKIVSVGCYKQGQEVTGTKVELTGKIVHLNEDFIGYIEDMGNGDNFPFYKEITMKDGKSFTVSVE